MLAIIALAVWLVIALVIAAFRMKPHDTHLHGGSGHQHVLGA